MRYCDQDSVQLHPGRIADALSLCAVTHFDKLDGQGWQRMMLKRCGHAEATADLRLYMF